MKRRRTIQDEIESELRIAKNNKRVAQQFLKEAESDLKDLRSGKMESSLLSIIESSTHLIESTNARITVLTPLVEK